MTSQTAYAHWTPQQLQALICEKAPPRERVAKQFVIDAFRGKMPSLIPFAFENESILNLASYLLKYTKSKSKQTLYQYVFGIHRFARWIQKKPDEMVREVILDKKALEAHVKAIDDFIGDLQAEDLADGTINNHVKGVKALFRVNGVALILPYHLPRGVKYSDRAPTREELAKLIDLADPREKVITSLLALGGFRPGTLAKLQYRHIKEDFEKGVVPIHVHVEAEITKGKYHAYDTFLGSEAVEYLKAYLELRRRGHRGVPPEQITDSSPLIRNGRAQVKPVTPANIHLIIHRLYLKAGLIKRGSGRRYELRAHSIRKYFRTQLGALSTVPTDYIEYMMGHTISTYNDIRNRLEDLRAKYASAELSIRPKSRLSKIEQLRILIETSQRALDDMLSKEPMAEPHRTVVDETAQRALEALKEAFEKAFEKELHS
jgi:integrase